ncbi:MAG TPA: tRNA pseudouridine(38-40) synthase TruA [Methylomirabilota bacterium]|jgi:tRNA pseudouridine38-40 synthase
MGKAGRTVRLTLAYDGTDLHGWQVQRGLETVQGLLMIAAGRVLGAPPKVTGASRTDAGVHALRQVASLATTSTMSAPVLQRALNALLPPSVRVLEAREAPSGFDARRWARGKRYVYLIDRRPQADPFLRRYAWHAPFPLDAAAMAAALRAVRGKHDFSAFCAAAGRDRTPTCTLRSARIVTRRQVLAVCISGDSFLHHMVRNLVGSLVEVGRGARPPGWIGDLLEGRDRRRAGPTAPAHGLVLVRVMYGPEASTGPGGGDDRPE